MRIDVTWLALEGLTLSEEFTALALDLENDIVRFRSPIKVRADISKITNALRVDLTLSALISYSCSRCLSEFEVDFKKTIQLHYVLGLDYLDQSIGPSSPLGVNRQSFDSARDASENTGPVKGCSRTINLDPAIREEIILDYPLKPLCKPDCKGLCAKCGKNLNEEKCSCAS